MAAGYRDAKRVLATRRRLESERAARPLPDARSA